MHNAAQTNPYKGHSEWAVQLGAQGWRVGWHFKGWLDGQVLWHLWRGKWEAGILDNVPRAASDVQVLQMTRSYVSAHF